MEKIKFNLVAAFAAICILFTSCLSDGDNESSASGVIGYVKMNATNQVVIYGLQSYPLSSTTLTTHYQIYGEGYIKADYKVNYDAPENAGYEKRGYAVANIAINDLNIASKEHSESVNEISGPKENEVVPAGIGAYYIALFNQLLVEVGVKNYNKDDRFNFQLEYEEKPEVVTTLNGYNVYDVYVRTTYIPSASTGKDEIRIQQFNITNLTSAVKAVESSSSKAFYIRLKYPSSIKDEKIEWITSNSAIYVSLE